MGQSPFTGAFDQEQIEMIEKAMLRAWEVVAYIDHIPDTAEDRKLLASCIVDEAMTGEENDVRLVNNAIVRFRAQRLRKTVQARKQPA